VLALKNQERWAGNNFWFDINFFYIFFSSLLVEDSEASGDASGGSTIDLPSVGRVFLRHSSAGISSDAAAGVSAAGGVGSHLTGGVWMEEPEYWLM
jgi:hypothetical protein